MKPTTEILARISQNSLANKEEVFTKLYRYLLRPDIYFVAYKNLYANNGAATKGVNEDTADGFSEAKIDSIIKALADETYQPMPVRRTYIQKKNNRKKLRPLGIPTFTDKLVQEVLRMILEAVYEPIHGAAAAVCCKVGVAQLIHHIEGQVELIFFEKQPAIFTGMYLFAQRLCPFGQFRSCGLKDLQQCRDQHVMLDIVDFQKPLFFRHFALPPSCDVSFFILTLSHRLEKKSASFLQRSTRGRFP